MRLMERILEPTKGYISFRDLLFRLSSMNNEPLHAVVTYLLHHELDGLTFYNIDADYKIIRFAPYEFYTVTEFLKEIQKVLSFSNEEWVWRVPASLEELSDQEKRELTRTIFKAMHCFFKESDLLSFEPLNGLLYFDAPNTEAKEKIDQSNNSLASFMTEYTLPQVVALILHIDLADITTNSSNSYINDQNKYDDSSYSKFNNLLQSYSVAALNNKLDGVGLQTRTATTFGGATETHIDLEKTTISRNNLVSYLNSIGYQFDGLLAKQEPAHTQHNSCQGSEDEAETVLLLRQQVEDLQAQLTAAESKENSLVIESESASIELGKYQKLLMGYPLLTAHQIACMLSNHNPVGQDYHNDDSYKLYKEMTDIAIDGRLLTVFNKKGHIAIEEVKIWLASNDILYEGFNEDWLESACEEEEEDILVKMNNQFNDIVRYLRESNDKQEEETEQLAAEYEELRLECEDLIKQNKDIRESLEQYKQSDNKELSQHWENESKKYKSKIEELGAVIDGLSDAETLNQAGGWQLYNWEAMDVSQYPPELHLAIEVWKRYYKVSDVEYTTQFNTGKFNRITKELNLKDGKLKSRIRSILTPLKSKKTSTDLLATLRDVDILYNDKMPD